ncbi:hypothetical protein KW528_21520 [Vibrio fluvialis]|uniref:hypothetical protein n=1 Tax=Vibrio fluvialis TaxID=676 RepID=UPI001C9D2D86|nr:hypothetical protein [Vibrio fluvialis]MBY8288639.1 hypothetical protein [Vibrio fluvialis]MCG6373425.1 hypothetical protein [Vibrio fluvialis]
MASYKVNGFSVKRVIETYGDLALQVLHLNLDLQGTTGKCSAINKKYRVREDERYTLYYLETELLKELTQAQQKQQNIKLGEFLERDYIFLDFKSDTSMQISASKI